MVPRRSVAADFCIAGAATSCAAVFTNPFEVVKTRMQLQNELVTAGTSKFRVTYPNAPAAFVSILRTEGLKGIQAGFKPVPTPICVLCQASVAGDSVSDCYERHQDRVSPYFQATPGSRPHTGRQHNLHIQVLVRWRCIRGPWSAVGEPVLSSQMQAAVYVSKQPSCGSPIQVLGIRSWDAGCS